MLFKNTRACVRLNENYTEWFMVSQGVRQGDTISPTLFILFLNDLITELNSLNLGLHIGAQIKTMLSGIC